MNKNKPKLLIFSQCFLYGGSERLMQSIYKNKYILSEYDIIFSYSYFKDYQLGIERDCKNQIIEAQIQALYLLTNIDLFHKINLKFNNIPLRYLLKMPTYFLESIGLFAIWNYTYFFIYLLIKRPHVLHINNGGYPAAKGCNQIARVALFFKNIWVVYQVNNKAFSKKNFSDILLDFWIKKTVDLFLTHSKQNQEALVKRGFDSEKIISIPSFFNETIRTDSIVTNSLSLGKFLLCMVGFLSYRKGQMFLLKALLVIKEKKPDIFHNLHLNLIGEGEERFALEKFILENNLKDYVTLWGERSDYINFIIGSDLFLITSVTGEDLPLVLLTAMQNKKCIIASEFAGMVDLLTNEHDAILIKPNTNTIAGELSDSIIKLYLNKELRVEIAQNAFNTFNDRLGEEKYAQNLTKLYSRANS